jgi:hypothetical protein
MEFYSRLNLMISVAERKGELMRRRTFEEMITYFNQTVSEMDIDRKYKMTLLGIVTAILQKHEEDVSQIVRCKDCKYFYKNKWCIRYLKAFTPDDYCSCAERRTDEGD